MGSPWLRMQAAHSTRKPVASFPVAVVELRLLALAPVGAVVVFVAMFATDGDFELLPHAASPITVARIASPPNLRYAAVMLCLVEAASESSVGNGGSQPRDETCYLAVTCDLPS